MKKYPDKINMFQLDYNLLKKIREIYYSMANRKYGTTEDMINKLQN